MSLLLTSLETLWRFKRTILGTASSADPTQAVPVSATNPLPVNIISGGLTSLGLKSLSRTSLTLTSSAQALPSIPAAATAARIVVEGGVARIATVPPVPTATDGDPWADGTVWQLEGRADLLGFRAILGTGNPVLRVTYLGAA